MLTLKNEISNTNLRLRVWAVWFISFFWFLSVLDILWSPNTSRNGMCYPLVAVTRQSRFDGTGLSPENCLYLATGAGKNAARTPSRVHYPSALPGRCVGNSTDYQHNG